MTLTKDTVEYQHSATSPTDVATPAGVATTGAQQ